MANKPVHVINLSLKDIFLNYIKSKADVWNDLFDELESINQEVEILTSLLAKDRHGIMNAFDSGATMHLVDDNTFSDIISKRNTHYLILNIFGSDGKLIVAVPDEKIIC